jgi:hypothetical protein
MTKKLPCDNSITIHTILPPSVSFGYGECDRFIKWIAKSELIKIQNQGGEQ